MKYKLKYVNCNLIKMNIINKNFEQNNKLINIEYSGGDLEFQSPKVFIEKIIKENDKYYLLLKLNNNEASLSFYNKLLEIEKYIIGSIPLKNVNIIQSVFDGIYFKVKIPFKYDKPICNIYYSNSLFNFYNLKEGMEIICLLSFNKLWVNFDTINYNLNATEINILNL